MRPISDDILNVKYDIRVILKLQNFQLQSQLRGQEQTLQKQMVDHPKKIESHNLTNEAMDHIAFQTCLKLLY